MFLNKKRLLYTILVLCLLLSVNSYAEIISMVCVDEKRSKEESRNVSIKLSFDENGNWAEIGKRKIDKGLKFDNLANIIEQNSIYVRPGSMRISHRNKQYNIEFAIFLNRDDGSMTQEGLINDKRFSHNYQCQKK